MRKEKESDGKGNRDAGRGVKKIESDEWWETEVNNAIEGDRGKRRIRAREETSKWTKSNVKQNIE